MKATLVLYLEVVGSPTRILSRMAELTADYEDRENVELIHVETLDQGDLEDRP